MSSHSRLTLSNPRNRNCRKPPALLDLPKHWLHRLHPQGVALPTPFRPQLPSHPVPGRQAFGYPPRGAGSGLVPWRVFSAAMKGSTPPAEFLDLLGRVVASVGGHFPGDCAHVVDGLLRHGHRLALVRGLVSGPGCHDHLVSTVHHRLAVVGLLEVPPAGAGHDA